MAFIPLLISLPLVGARPGWRTYVQLYDLTRISRFLRIETRVLGSRSALRGQALTVPHNTRVPRPHTDSTPKPTV